MSSSYSISLPKFGIVSFYNFSSCYFISGILMGFNLWYLILILVYIFLITKDMTYLLYICWLFYDVFILPILKNCIVEGFQHKFVGIHFISYMTILWQILYFLVCSLLINSLIKDAFDGEKFSILIKSVLYIFFSMVSTFCSKKYLSQDHIYQFISFQVF